MNQLWTLILLLLTACGAQLPRSTAPVALTVEPGPQSGSPVLRAQMDGLTKALEKEGFQLGDQQIEAFLPQGARRADSLNMPAKTCVAFVAIASAAVIDLDAGLYTPEGEGLVEDENVDARPVLSLCSGDEPRKLYYTLHAYQGGGAVLARSFVRPQTPRDRPLPSSASRKLTEWSVVAARLKARGFSDDGQATDLDLLAGDALRVAIPAEAGTCYTWLGEPEPGLLGLTLRVLDPSGRELARGEHDDGGPLTLQLCAAHTDELVLLVSASEGHGKLRLSRFRGPEARVGGASALWLGEPRSEQSGP